MRTVWTELSLLIQVFWLVGGNLSVEGSEENKVASSKRLRKTQVTRRLICLSVSCVRLCALHWPQFQGGEAGHVSLWCFGQEGWERGLLSLHPFAFPCF